jgi:aspartyl-tRNA synthetase
MATLGRDERTLERYGELLHLHVLPTLGAYSSRRPLRRTAALPQRLRYGCPRDGGLGLGLTRLLMVLLQLESIREATFLFRGPTRLTP